jgi:hypothetical protein
MLPIRIGRAHLTRKDGLLAVDGLPDMDATIRQLPYKDVHPIPRADIGAEKGYPEILPIGESDAGGFGSVP